MVITYSHSSTLNERNEETLKVVLEMFWRDTERRETSQDTRESGTFWAPSLHKLSWRCRAHRHGVDSKFVWTEGQTRSRGSERMLRTLRVGDSAGTGQQR